MDFINKHYEKLILIGMLVFFIFAMVNVWSIAVQTKRVKSEDLRIKEVSPDYKVQVASDKSLQISTIQKEGIFSWNRASIRNKNLGMLFYSDLTDFPELAHCFVGKDDAGKESGCGRLVPRTYFTDKPCPHCGRILKVPPKRPKMRRNVITADDSDGDGMSNADEDTYKFDKGNPYDALYDADGDGFANVYELEQKTNPTIARSHPPFWYRLRLVAVRRVVLPVRFTLLNINGNEKNPNVWQVHFNLEVEKFGRKTFQTTFKRIGDTIAIEKRRYRIKRIERIISDASSGQKKQEVVAGSTIKVEEKAQDLSKVYLEQELSYTERQKKIEPDKLVMQVGRPAYSSDRRPIFEDVGFPEGKREEMVLRINEIFPKRTSQNRPSPFANYRLRSFDAEKMVAQLERVRVYGRQDSSKDERGDSMLVTTQGKIPEDCRVIAPVEGFGATVREVEPERQRGRGTGSRRR